MAGMFNGRFNWRVWLRQSVLALVGGWCWTVGLSASPMVWGADWPQILGSTRQAMTSETVSTNSLKQSPKPVWQRDVGTGFAGVAVVGSDLALFHRIGRTEVVELCDVDTGEARWTQQFPTSYQASIVDDDGPRCVPCLLADQVITYGATGRLSSLSTKSGDVLWSRELNREYRASEGYFGAGSSPLIDLTSDMSATTNSPVAGQVIVNVGGKQQSAGVVAVDLNTGKTRWTAINDDASYSAPVRTTVGDQQVLLVLTRLNLVGLNPANGEELFRTPFGQRGPTVNAALPLVVDDQVLLTASYGIGAQWLKLTASNRTLHATVVWDDPLLSSQYTTPVYRAGWVYGVDGRQDGGQSTLICFDPLTRRVGWKQPLSEYATLIGTETGLLVFQTDGELSLIDWNPQLYQRLARCQIGKGTFRALPALANGRLYVRNSGQLTAVTIGPEKSAP